MKTQRMRVFGVVQGVGFRPFVKRLADEMGLGGTVRNDGPYVEIVVSGDDSLISDFKERLETDAPQAAMILRIDVDHSQGREKVYSDFSIEKSRSRKGQRYISPDIATCSKCVQELYDPNNRRYLHPFINCTNCGPRLTVIRSLPYDREQTSMADFEMCDECAAEYEDVSDRRFDAQPLCCPHCGPRVYAFDIKDVPEEYGDDNLPANWPEDHMDGAAITLARRKIAEGGIVAVKGIGGFHLACDATNPEAVNRLRRKKRRPDKPLAIMGKNIDVLKRVCVIDNDAQDMLTSAARPIVILPRKGEAVGGNIIMNTDGELELVGDLPVMFCAPGNPNLGVFLPYSPVHHLLFDYPDDVEMPEYLVMTSGNVSGAPVATSDAEVIDMLSGICDMVLSNNREILVRADDSVLQMYEGKPYMIRRSRGFAPLPVENDDDTESVLAVGGELKSTFTLKEEGRYYPSSFIGELSDVRTRDALESMIDFYSSSLHIEPERVVCDLHPEYISGGLARAIATRDHIRLVVLQHHFAHVLSCMAENAVTDPVLGLALDGTGFGADGNIWGGELLRVDRNGYQRLYSIAPFSQMGGDAAVLQGWRVASGMLLDQYTHSDAHMHEVRLGLSSEAEWEAVSVMFEQNVRKVTSTSCGRLFDAVSAILGICRESTFEGEAAMKLQFAAQRAYRDLQSLNSRYVGSGIDSVRERVRQTVDDREYTIRRERGLGIIPTDAVFRYIIDSYESGGDVDMLALEFHMMLAELFSRACHEAAQESGIRTVALTGGCFVNTLLLRLTEDALRRNMLLPIRHHYISPNDGGLSLGQAYYEGPVD